MPPRLTAAVEILVERRRLGQTDLTVKPAQIGIINATRVESLGIFDYAHLRVPLPKDLEGSGIFSLQKNLTYPESYFLMVGLARASIARSFSDPLQRRSTDGYISATGMFKAAFPWASSKEQEVERVHHKILPSAGDEEVANNIWISPSEGTLTVIAIVATRGLGHPSPATAIFVQSLTYTTALELADEYRMRPWIVALLDPAPIEIGTKDKHKSSIATPPKFVLQDKDKLFLPPPSMSASARKRSASPTKSPRKMASPRKRAARGASVTKSDASESDLAKKASKALQSLTNGASATPSSATEDVVRVEVDETVEKENDIETTHTMVKVEIPANHPDLPLPESTEEMIAKAKEMVEEASKLEEKKKRGRPSKRKADEAELADDTGAAGASDSKSAKRQRMVETLKKERVKTRALLGLAATLAIGLVLLLGWFVVMF